MHRAAQIADLTLPYCKKDFDETYHRSPFIYALPMRFVVYTSFFIIILR